jgi:hypothetical protein
MLRLISSTAILLKVLSFCLQDSQDQNLRSVRSKPYIVSLSSFRRPNSFHCQFISQRTSSLPQNSPTMAAPTITNTVFRGVEGAVKKTPVEIPSTLGPKEILIKITHSSLCSTDTHMIAHGMALGHEGVGIVEKIGEGVTQFKVGDRAGAGYLRNVSL